MKILNRLPAIFVAILIQLNSTLHAEVVLDGTLGPRITLDGPNFLIDDTLGKQMGSNLFHSFESFTINTGESATFAGPNTLKNVISRVTGNNASWIDGTLHSQIPNADIYFLNPNGIMFGENARLDINGSFYASTADYLRLKDGQNFYVNKSDDFSLMVAPPSSFGFLNSTPADITVDGSTLQIPARKTLSLIGGNLGINNGGTLYAPDGQINIVSIASTGEVVPSLSNTATKLGKITLSHPSSIERYKINGTEIANIDTSGIRGGEIFIQSGQLFSTGGRIASKVIPNASQVQDKAQQQGHITILAKEIVELSDSDISVNAEKGTYNDAGDIFIETNTMVLKESCEECGISSDTFGTGNSGNIEIMAAETLTITDSGISVTSRGGDAGYIDLEVGQLTLDNGFLNSGTLGSGIGGDISIAATQGITLTGGSLIASSVGGIGIAGFGKGGNIYINAPYLEVEGFFSGVQTSVFASSLGDSGNIQIDVDHLTLKNYGSILALTSGSGQGGNIVISSIDTELKEKGLINSGSLGKGNAGSISLMTNRLSLTDKSFIVTSAIQSGGGNITANVRDYLHLSTSEISTQAGGKTEQDKGGNITINKPKLVVLNKSNLLASAFHGNGGNIKVIADHFINSSDSIINASSELGIDGEIQINARDMDFIDIQLRTPSRPLPKLSLDRCAGFSREDLSRFIITIRDIPPPTPEDFRM